MDISNRIKQIREAKRIKQIEISNALEMNNSYYARLEKRGSKLTLEQIEKIAGALGVSVVELLGLDSPQAIEQVSESEKDKEITELRKKVAELERRNNLFEGNAYVIESISRKLINGIIEISYQTAKYFNSDDLLENDKYRKYDKLNEEYRKESRRALQEFTGQSSFFIILKKLLFEQKDKIKIILEWILNDRVVRENPLFGYEKCMKLVRESLESYSTEDIIQEAMDLLFIPFFSDIGTDRQKSNEESDKI
jgi:transcriptional regulator with XRE-family HTH domain